jgi:predicted DNA-binding ribbon-helix-helix protein
MGPKYPSLVIKRSVFFGGFKTSVHLEDAFWVALKEIAAAQGTRASQLVAAIDKERRERQYPNLSSAVRLFVLDHYRCRAALKSK